MLTPSEFKEIKSYISNIIKDYDEKKWENISFNTTDNEEMICIPIYADGDPKLSTLYLQICEFLNNHQNRRHVKISDPEPDHYQPALDGGSRRFRFQISIA